MIAKLAVFFIFLITVEAYEGTAKWIIGNHEEGDDLLNITYDVYDFFFRAHPDSVRNKNCYNLQTFEY